MSHLDLQIYMVSMLFRSVYTVRALGAWPLTSHVTRDSIPGQIRHAPYLGSGAPISEYE